VRTASPPKACPFVAIEDGRLVGTVRLWHVTAGPGRAVLLLGPLAVCTRRQGRGIGSSALMAARHQGGAALRRGRGDPGG